MEDFSFDTKPLLFITTNQNNDNYKKFLEIIKKKNIETEMNKRNLQLNINTIMNETFLLCLMFGSGLPLICLENFNENSFPQIFKKIDDITSQRNNISSQKGGKSHSFDYKQKYFKYKNKYLEIKNIITKFQI